AGKSKACNAASGPQNDPSPSHPCSFSRDRQLHLQTQAQRRPSGCRVRLNKLLFNRTCLKHFPLVPHSLTISLIFSAVWDVLCNQRPAPLNDRPESAEC